LHRGGDADVDAWGAMQRWPGLATALLAAPLRVLGNHVVVACGLSGAGFWSVQQCLQLPQRIVHLQHLGATPG